MDNKLIARKNDTAMVAPLPYTVEKPETNNKKKSEVMELIGGGAIWLALGLIFGKPVWIGLAVLLVGGFVCGLVARFVWEFIKDVWQLCTEGKPVGLVKVNTNGK